MKSSQLIHEDLLSYDPKDQKYDFYYINENNKKKFIGRFYSIIEAHLVVSKNEKLMNFKKQLK